MFTFKEPKPTLHGILKILIGGLLLTEIPANAEKILIDQIRIVDDIIHLSWQDEGQMVQLEQSETLERGSWEIIKSDIDDGVAAVASSKSMAFFRLRTQLVNVDIPPFGCDLSQLDCEGVSLPPWCFGLKSINQWPESNTSSTHPPLKFDYWQGPYQNKAGFDGVELINRWFKEGTAAGLTQDAFRSFDSGHSSIRDFYPQLSLLEPASSYASDCRDVFEDRITFAVQSLAASNDLLGNGISIIDYYSQGELLFHYNRNEFLNVFGSTSPNFTRAFYRQFFESNVLLISPAVNSFKRMDEGFLDRFTWLSPYYLHSLGRSGSDRRLLKPIIFAAASLPAPLKTRILRNGMQAPVLIWLFKNSFNELLSTAEIHAPAHELPKESDTPPPLPENGQTTLEAYRSAGQESAPYFEELIQTAHQLEHIPPVTRLKHVTTPIISGGTYEIEPYLQSDPYSVHAALRPDETLTLKLDLTMSWTDEKPIKSFHIQKLREPESGISSTINGTKLHEGIVDLSIPWQDSTTSNHRRSDFMLYINDGTYDSLAAYISIRHLQESDKVLFQF